MCHRNLGLSEPRLIIGIVQMCSLSFWRPYDVLWIWRGWLYLQWRAAVLRWIRPDACSCSFAFAFLRLFSLLGVHVRDGFLAKRRLHVRC